MQLDANFAEGRFCFLDGLGPAHPQFFQIRNLLLQFGYEFIRHTVNRGAWFSGVNKALDFVSVTGDLDVYRVHFVDLSE